MKKKKSLTWHKKGGYDAPIFIPCTPGSELAKRIKQLEENSGKQGKRSFRVRVVESSGMTFRHQLQRSDPWAGEPCGREGCFPCAAEGGGDCGRSNVTYEISCSECQDPAAYIGETGRTMYSRGKEHLEDYSREKPSSALWEHCQKYHDSTHVNFKMRCTGKFNKPNPRQITEGVKIHNFAGLSLNRRSEWKIPVVARMDIRRDVREEEDLRERQS